VGPTIPAPAVTLETRQPGLYTVTSRSSVDGHIVDNRFTFTESSR
jgi:hypothetical protein